MNKIMYKLFVTILDKYSNKKDICFDTYYDLQEAINSGLESINYFIEDSDYNDDYCKFEDRYDLRFYISCINEYKDPNIISRESKIKYIYNKYKETNNLFNSIIDVINCTLSLDHNGDVEDCFWNAPYINYTPSFKHDINEYEYSNGTMVEYDGGIYMIAGHSDIFKAEDILNGYINVYHSYSMYGIKDEYYDHIRCDDKINVNNISTEISCANNVIAPFIKNIMDVVDSSINENNIVDEDLIMSKYYYWLATREIKLDLKIKNITYRGI